MFKVDRGTVPLSEYNFQMLNCSRLNIVLQISQRHRKLLTVPSLFTMSLPPDLQVLCRRLASTDPADLPPLCPSLVGHIQRCESVLSLAVDQKPKDGASEHSVLVHKLKTQITTLLNNGRSLPGRFAAVILVKAVVDVGGYECLRTSEPWVRGQWL